MMPDWGAGATVRAAPRTGRWGDAGLTALDESLLDVLHVGTDLAPDV